MAGTLSLLMKLPSNPRICLVLLSAVGDVTHALPIVNAIKRHRPQSHITWLLQEAGASLIQGHPAVDEILLFQRKAGLAGFVKMAMELADRPFDVVLDLQCYFKATLLTALCRAPVKIGLDPSRAREFNWLVNNHHLPKRPIQHVQEHFLEFLDYLEIPREPIEWNLGPWPPELEWQTHFFRHFPSPRVALVAGTSNPKKDWIPDSWVRLNDALHEQFDLHTVLVGANSPRETALGKKKCCRSVVIPPRRHWVVAFVVSSPFSMGATSSSRPILALFTSPVPSANLSSAFMDTTARRGSGLGGKIPDCSLMHSIMLERNPK